MHNLIVSFSLLLFCSLSPQDYMKKRLERKKDLNLFFSTGLVGDLWFLFPQMKTLHLQYTIIIFMAVFKDGEFHSKW